MPEYSDPLGLLYSGLDWLSPPKSNQGLLQLTPQEIERMAAAQSPAFGLFPQMQARRTVQDPIASANVPVDIMRGRLAGTLGLFGDVVNQPIPLVRPLQLLSQYLTDQPKYPDTEYFLENLPLKSETPVGDVAGRIGSFVPLNPAPLVKGAQKLGGLLGEEMTTRLSTGKPILPSLLAEPQVAMFATEPNAPRMGLMESQAPQDVGGLLNVKPQAPVSDIGFYSAAEQAALNLQRNKGTGQAFLNDLIKGENVKKDELKWIGLDDYLKDKPNVTKQEVQDFIANNKVDVQEVTLGGSVNEDPIGIAKRKAIFDKYEPEIQALYREMDNPKYKLVDKGVNSEEYSRGVVLQNRAFRGETLTTQEQFELNDILNRLDNTIVREFPNVEEARNFYLSMSPEEKLQHSIRPVKNSTELQQEINNLQRNRDAEADAAYLLPEALPTKFGKYTLKGGKNYREMLLTMPFKEPAMPKGYEVTSMQYDDGTVRYFANTPTTRSKGYATEEEAKSELQRMTESLKDWRASQASYESSHWDQPNVLAHLRVNDRVDADGKKMLLIEEVQSDWHQAGREKGYGPKIDKSVEAYYETKDGQRIPIGFGKTKEEAEASIDVGWKNMVDIKYETIERKVGEGVPDAPMKEKWYQLALKRAIKYAADNGYDRIGLTTGARQAERYDLSKEIKSIIYSEQDESGLRRVTAITNSGDQLLGKKYSPSEIESNIGKEMADKINNSIGEFDKRTKTYAMTGLDLKVGGEGMKKYYDEIYPKFLDSYGKKWGARVGETTINLDEGSKGYMPIKDMRVEPIRYLDITPEMKKSIKKGQPLFSQAPTMPETGLLA